VTAIEWIHGLNADSPEVQKWIADLLEGEWAEEDAGLN
jgi:hypothetical protein